MGVFKNPLIELPEQEARERESARIYKEKYGADFGTATAPAGGEDLLEAEQRHKLEQRLKREAEAKAREDEAIRRRQEEAKQRTLDDRKIPYTDEMYDARQARERARNQSWILCPACHQTFQKDADGNLPPHKVRFPSLELGSEAVDCNPSTPQWLDDYEERQRKFRNRDAGPQPEAPKVPEVPKGEVTPEQAARDAESLRRYQSRQYS